MRIIKNLTLILTGLFLVISCSESGYKFKLNTTKKVVLGNTVPVTFEQIQGDQLDSLKLYINGTFISKDKTKATLNSVDLGVGKHLITALAFYPNSVKKVSTSLEVLSDIKPRVYKYKIINTFPHNTQSYTQGLEFHNGFLYETTGQRGKSKLLKVDLSTGKILQEVALSKSYFGEGMTIFNNTIYWLTWQGNKGFTYSLEDFKKKGEFSYGKSLQGWGLTHNETELIKSDGTNKIWFLNPNTLQEKRHIQAYTDKYAVDNLNELELINGKIYANKWQQNSIVIINPQTGVVEGVANLNGLRDLVAKKQKLETGDDVLNGIAYDKDKNRLYVTGKHWGQLFEIELIKQ